MRCFGPSQVRDECQPARGREQAAREEGGNGGDFPCVAVLNVIYWTVWITRVDWDIGNVCSIVMRDRSNRSSRIQAWRGEGREALPERTDSRDDASDYEPEDEGRSKVEPRRRGWREWNAFRVTLTSAPSSAKGRRRLQRSPREGRMLMHPFASQSPFSSAKERESTCSHLCIRRNGVAARKRNLQ